MNGIRDRLQKLEAQTQPDDAEPEWARQRNAAKRAAFNAAELYAELEKVKQEVGEERFSRDLAAYFGRNRGDHPGDAF